MTMSTPAAFLSVPAEFQTIVRWTEAVDCPHEDEADWTDPYVSDYHEQQSHVGKSLEIQKTRDNYCAVLLATDEMMQNIITRLCEEIGCKSRSFYQTIYNGREHRAHLNETTGSGRYEILHTVIPYRVNSETGRVASVVAGNGIFGGFFFRTSIAPVVITEFCEQAKDHSAVQKYVEKQGQAAEKNLHDYLLPPVRQLVESYLGSKKG